MRLLQFAGKRSTHPKEDVVSLVLVDGRAEPAERTDEPQLRPPGDKQPASPDEDSSDRSVAALSPDGADELPVGEQPEQEKTFGQQGAGS